MWHEEATRRLREKGEEEEEKREGKKGGGEERDNGLSTPPGCENAPNFRTNAVSIYGWLLQERNDQTKAIPQRHKRINEWYE